MKLKNISLLFLIVFTISLKSQQIGSWRLHFNYSVSKEIAYSENIIMSANHESLLIYDTDDKSIRELDKANSLSDIGVRKLAYCKDEKTFIVAYNSTNIDLITNDYALTNIPDIQNKIISTSKNINNIFIHKSNAYFSTDMGIIVLDIKNQEIDNTYIIGDAGDPESVKDCVIFRDTIYALMGNGNIKTAPLEGANLLDFSSWKKNKVKLPSINIKFIEVYNDVLYVMVNNEILKKQSNTWESIYSVVDSNVISLQASEKLICIIKVPQSSEKFLIIDENTIDTIINENSIKPTVAIIDDNETFFVGDLGWGLIDYNNNKRLIPSGKPFSSDIFSFSSRGNKIFAAAGLFETNAGNALRENINGFYYFTDFSWKSINRFTIEGLDNVINFLEVKENPIDKKVYGATTSGLVVFDYKKISVLDTTNSILELKEDTTKLLYVTGVDFDSKGNIWMVNSHTANPLKVLTQTGEWYQYPLSLGGVAKKYSGVFIDSYDQVWVRGYRDGLSLFPKLTELAGLHNNESIVLDASTANLPNDNVNVIVEDKNGVIWVGTDEGIGVFDCPENIFDSSKDCIISRRIKSTLDDYTEYLFDTDVVKAIAVDGANRKWIGTTAGLWLVSESGEEVLLSFNIDNSPLPSNEIISIAIHEQSGEVFIGTSAGMVSYVGDATEPAEDISNIKVFPNPVAPEYFGTISVTGLTANSYIKITDISGILIDDGYALGGKFVWDGKDYNGIRASTGVYLIFSADNKNKNKAVAKIVFIN